MKINEKIFETLKNNYTSADVWTYWSSKVFTFYNIVFIVGFSLGLFWGFHSNFAEKITQKIFTVSKAKYVKPNYTKSITYIKELAGKL